MKWSLAPVVFAIVVFAMSAFGQQASQTVYYNPMGQTMPSPSVSTQVNGKTTTRTEKRQSLNGQWVPAETVEERVVRDDAQGRTVERYIRRYDMNGNPAASEKVVVEQEKRAGGESSVRTSTFRSDMNGNLNLAERSVAESRNSVGGLMTTEVVDRPSINGSLETAEKRSTVARATSDGEVRNTSVYKRNDNGQFVEAIKQVSESKKGAAGATESLATYEAGTGSGSGFRLVGQTVKRAGKNADGSERIEVDVYTANVPGVLNTTDKPQLREQRVIVRKAQGGAVSETVDVRRPSVSDPTRLGAPIRFSETVCKGKCE